MTQLARKIAQGWKKLTSSLDSRVSAERALLEALQHDYLEEQQVSEVLERESERIPYAHLRQKLLEIAAREKQHAELLAAKIQELNGRVPERAQARKAERESQSDLTTLDLLTMLQEEKEESIEYLKTAHLAKEAGKAEWSGLLQQIAEEERQHRRELIDVLTRLNPLPVETRKP